VSENPDAKRGPAFSAKNMNARPLPKRFYKVASVGNAPDGAGFSILLDQRTAKTPAKRALVVPYRALAEDISAEWATQANVVDPATMPLTTLAITAIDAVAGREANVAAQIVEYSGSDLLCYRADSPEALAARQAALWDPILAWAASDLGARFVLGEGVMPVTQPPEATAAIACAIAGMTPLPLAALHVMTTLTGSALLALAVRRKRLSADGAWAAAHVDEDFQISQWGEDTEATTRRAKRWTEMQAAARVIAIAEAR
jgi:chaperone required for assembly of F1-ATPase